MIISRQHLRRIVVAVDPATTSGDNSDETGIIVVAEGPHIEVPDAENICKVGNCKKHAYVLDDQSGRYSTDTWARVVTDCYHKWGADRIVAEGNQGGEMVEAVIRTVFPGAPIRRVTARQGKRTRAEPVAALYEQGRVHHVGAFVKLEDQLTSWTIDSGESPDRLDALVWGITELGLTKTAGGRDWLEAMAPPCPYCTQPNPTEATRCSKCGEALEPTVPPEGSNLASPLLDAPSGTIASTDPNQAVLDAIRQYGPSTGFQPFQRRGW